MKGPIQSVEVTCLVHATEDAGKVEKAIAALLGTQAAPAHESLEGHFGNQIVRARLHLTGDEAGKAFEQLRSGMSKGVRREVLDELPAHLDEHSALYLRFDKQKLMAGQVALGSADSVRVKVKPRGFMMKGTAGDFYAPLIGGE